MSSREVRSFFFSPSLSATFSELYLQFAFLFVFFAVKISPCIFCQTEVRKVSHARRYHRRCNREREGGKARNGMNFLHDARAK